MGQVIYVVSGVPRSGTSMMCQCLQAGGMEVVQSSKRDEQANKRWSDELYQTNQNGFYESTLEEMQADDFPPEGKVVKLITEWLKFLRGHKAKVIFMLRHPEEIRQSSEALAGGRYLVDGHEKVTGSCIDRLEQQGCEVVRADYRSIVEDPLSFFETLDWPIDAAAAASVVNPDLYRFRLERLVVGL